VFAFGGAAGRAGVGSLRLVSARGDVGWVSLRAWLGAGRVVRGGEEPAAGGSPGGGGGGSWSAG